LLRGRRRLFQTDWVVLAVGWSMFQNLTFAAIVEAIRVR
jgi:hypothetical protein